MNQSKRVQEMLSSGQFEDGDRIMFQHPIKFMCPGANAQSGDVGKITMGASGGGYYVQLESQPHIPPVYLPPEWTSPEHIRLV